MKSEKRLIVVIGMHRSGTSAITRGLELLGVGLGTNLHPAASDNPKGFWEDSECLEINEELLSYFGSAYDQLGGDWDTSIADSEISRIKLKASQLISRKLEENKIWGFKDPRTSRLLPFWKEVFRSVECDVSYVIALRNPVSIVDSLSKRNNIPAEKTYFLWLQHMLPALQMTEGARRVVVDYDEFMDAPYDQMKRVGKFLDLPIAEQGSQEVAIFEGGFLDKGLRHSRYSEAQLRLDSRASSIVYDTYQFLSKLSRDELENGESVANEVLLQLQTEFIRFFPLIDLVNNLEDERRSLWSTIARLELINGESSQRLSKEIADSHQLNTQLLQLGIDREQLNTQVLQFSVDRDQLNTQLLQLRVDRDQLNTQLLQLRVDRDQLNTQLLQLGVDRDQLSIELQQKNQKINDLENRVRDLERELDQILNSSSWTITKPLRFLRRVMHDRVFKFLIGKFGCLARTVWHKLPFSIELKSKIKSILFTKLPILFSWSQAYRSWYGMNFPSFDLPYPATFTNQNDEDSAGRYVPLLRSNPPKKLPVRLIAFYLPQFHAIKENNEWWGEGFTEWTNVKPARPQFDGHYQPHVPGELGYYNLLDRDVQKRQIELAKLYGVGGFCFYYYWFGGKRLLEQPIENYLADSSLDHPFCLCWANENWSRRWDGKDSEVLIAQQHSPEDDLAFAADVARYMKDSRYIRVDGKPLLVVYRPSLLPSAFETSQRWRKWFRDQGIGEIYLAYTQSFEVEDPRTYGFDAAIEFPPNNSAPPNITSQVKAFGSFGGTVYDWSVFLKRSQNYKKTPYRLFRSVCPSWDNTARRKNGGTVFLNSTPKDYQAWLENAVAETCQQSGTADEKLVFVNAWNEWAEGAHLEPDAKYGYAWLDATRRALTGEAYGAQKINIALISHDAHPHGAQFLALGMVRSLVNDLKLLVHTVLLGEGRLRGEFAQYSPVYDLLPGPDFERRSFELARELAEKGIEHAIVNTTVSGSFVEALTSQGIRCVSLIHEMPGVIEANNLSEQAKDIARFAHRVVFPASIVESGFAGFADIDEDKKVIRPQGLWRRNLLRFNKYQVRKEVRERFGMALNAPIVLAVGYADRRKGVDLFAKAALEVLASKPDVVFIWIGHWDDLLRREVEAIVKERVSSFKFLGYEPDTASYHVAADVYALTSREDPFPNVVLESFDAGVPVVAFEGSGGGAKLASKTGGRVVPMEDVSAFAHQLVSLLDHPETTQALGQQASSLVDQNYAFRSYLFDLCEYSGIKLPRVSVVVPNYNYAQYIVGRLDSILNQSLPIYELIILDDASTDESVFEIKKWLSDNKVECRLIVNEKNSGSVFEQWAKGVALATGDFVWIAEADDLSASDFLETVIAPMERDSEVSISYCESQQINGQSLLISDNYQAYRQDICNDHWQVPYIADGDDEVIKYMAVKNTIPNVSGVLFKRQAISDTFLQCLAEIRSLSKAGDWLTYIKVLRSGKIAFTPRPLNFHRRHSGSVIGGSNASRLLEEISIVQSLVASEYSLSSAVALQAKSYIEELRGQFSQYDQVSK